MKTVSLDAIRLRGGVIASRCGTDRKATTQALVNAHIARGFEIKMDGIMPSGNSLDFGSAGSFDPNKTQPLPAMQA